MLTDNTIEKPNPVQTWEQFNYQAKQFETLFNHYFIYRTLDKGVAQYWIVPPTLLQIKP